MTKIDTNGNNIDTPPGTTLTTTDRIAGTSSGFTGSGQGSSSPTINTEQDLINYWENGGNAGHLSAYGDAGYLVFQKGTNFPTDLQQTLVTNVISDYNLNNKIELKNLEDSFASAANYINKIGWKKGEPCFYRVKLEKKINNKYINSSARNIENRLKISKWKKKGITSFDGSNINSDLKAALILPDGSENSPAYLVFQNYEKILKWNRSLRFAISVCTLSNKIKS